jgi:hypothetical protein
MKLVLERTRRLKKEDRVGNFVTDACATVAVAYHRAAGVYVGNEEMEKLGTAAGPSSNDGYIIFEFETGGPP